MRIGIDLGGTKTEIVALQGSREVMRRRIKTPQQAGYQAIVQALADLVRLVENELGETGSVGIGTPGAIEPDSGHIVNSNTLCLNGRPLQADMSDALERPVRIANDADCFALSEATDGAGAGARVVFGVIMGTGTGGGIVVDQRLLAGPNAIAGEWGHNPLPYPTDAERPGPGCYCGRAGCIETWLSGPAVKSDHLRVTGKTATAEQISEAARRGDAESQATLARHTDRSARALAGIINVLDPHVIVLGGGVGAMPGFAESLQHALPPYVFSNKLRTRITAATHGDSSGVRGAAWLWPAA